MKTTLVHASIIRRVFRKIILTSIVIPAAGAPFIFACSGGGGDLDDGTSSGQSGTSGSNGPSGSGTGTGSERDNGTSGASGTSGSSGSSGVQAPCGAIPADAPVCGNYSVDLTGNLSTCEFDSEGNGSTEYCKKMCGERGFISSCKRSGNSVSCTSPCAVDGRRYTALDDRSAPAADDIGSYLARMAFFEAASVDSFALLERELKMHHAPISLVRSCAQARRDETRHARMATRLAKRHGGHVVEPPTLQASPAARELEEIAVENAVEGCVRETFGVLVGLWQAEHAKARELRAYFTALATDETRHAALASRIDAWILPRLSPAARGRVEAARSRALDMLEASLASTTTTTTTTTTPTGLGLPTADEAKALFDRWRAATVDALAA